MAETFNNWRRIVRSTMSEVGPYKRIEADLRDHPRIWRAWCGAIIWTATTVLWIWTSHRLHWTIRGAACLIVAVVVIAIDLFLWVTGEVIAFVLNKPNFKFPT